MFLDEVSAFFDVVAHEDAEESVCFSGVVEFDFQQCPALGVHSGVPELVSVHFAETFEAFDLDSLAADLSDSGAYVCE